MDLIQKILLEEVSSNKTPSIQYILFNRETIIKKYCSGYANIEKNSFPEGNTTYNGYSVTKTFTALAILQLAEQNRLDLDKHAKIYLTEFPYHSGITIRQLLTHTSGIPNPIPLSWIHLKDEHQTFDRNEFFKNIFAKNNKTKSNPNEKYAYSNLGYVLLGQIIEKVTGITYEQYIRDNIFNRIGLHSNELGFEIADITLQAKGYHKRLSFSNLFLGLLIDKSKFIDHTEGKWNSFNSFYLNGTSYGGLIGTPVAFVKYIQELLTADNRLLSDRYKSMLFTENITNDKKRTGMCLSWFTGQLNGKKYFAHAGGGGGYYCEIRIYPEEGIGSVIFFNRTGMSDERYLDKVDRIYFGSHP